MDVHSPRQRSFNMSQIKARHTKPELVIRRGLHRMGLRYRLHVPDLAGKPDLVFPRHRAVICVNGCFWHGHNCPLFRLPGTRTEFWKEKISANVARDERNQEAVQADGWRVAIVWECSIRGRLRLPQDAVLNGLVAFLRGTSTFVEFSHAPVTALHTGE